MQIHFTKVVHFTRLIKAGGRLREFNFRKLGGINEGIFTVDVSDDRGNRILFRMKKDDDNNWKIIPQPLPEWIQDKESSFHELIQEELDEA